MIVCPACGTQNGDRAKFCQECAAPLRAPAAAAGETRKTVTVLFCDVTGSTALGERLDPEATRSVMTGYFAAMARVIESHGGTVEKFIGDAVMAVFGVPTLHEDDALRALRAAVGMRTALAELNTDFEQRYGARLAARIGVNTGEVVVGGDGSRGTVATGDAVNVGARLEQAAGPDEILFGPQTYALVRDHVEAEPVTGLILKGKSGPVTAWRLHGVSAPGSAARPVRLTSPLVGRDRELALMEQTLARCRADRRSQLLTVLGAAGVGKSRLAADFLAGAAAGTTVLSGRCLSYGEDIAFYPLLEMLQGLAGVTPGEDTETSRRRLRTLVADDPDADRLVERLAPLAGLPGTPAAVEETHWAVRRLVERLGHESPVLVVLDDAHWAEHAMLDLVDHLADWTRDTPCLLLCLARPELLDDRPTWGGGKVNASTLLLEPLPGDDAESLLANLLGDAVLDADTRRRILDAAG
ncbi:MAG TPA: adenylate/guanylate cyclase domain-containing protein, partial [Actinomycetes bacterium]|nr:adenylate/guanylate cyclase domain-containing protein [Actinomycetes bacterium]